MPNKLFNFLILLFGFLAEKTFSSPFEIARLSTNIRAIEQKNYQADETPHPLKGIKIRENMGSFIDLNLEFINEKGQIRALKDYFQNQPVLMTVVYYNCPSICNFHLNGLFKAFNNLKWSNYQFVVVSMDSTETSLLASQKKENYLKEFNRLKKQQVHFLTGSQSSIKKLTDSLGFVFRWDEETQQFAHSPVAYSLSSKGMISRYLYGIEFLSQTLRLALLEAGRGKVGNMIDRILLFCYRFNPKENKYSLYAVNIMKAGGILIVIALISLLAPAWIKERKSHI